ncbi:D-alanyl-D-alanine carboxypeptidase/D-alanyl-D-alanine endopeptidase [Angustibacter sp. McL0619]|uniref:D-alanyl-D-alanine carboxypeptidase/D-alanyl-D-alanine endopeptidase n=1 Tax=Angustibacter sp. McL0619 TaxID=3415676 RepID=UPI003CFA47B9
MPRARWLAAAVAVLALGYVAADVEDAVPGALTTDPASAGPAPTRPTPSDPPRTPPTSALPALSAQAPAPTSESVSRVLDPLLSVPALGPQTSATVLDPVSGQVLLDRTGSIPRTPASTAKLLTAAAVLSTVGGGTTLPTRVVQGATADEVVLVGSGDVMLGTGRSVLDQVHGHAGLLTLAEQVAVKLRAEQRTKVAVRFDDSVFTGPSVSRAWAATDVPIGFVGPITALGLDRNLARLGHRSPADPSQSAADAFAAALRAQGITVVGLVARSRANAGSPVLGEVRSAPVGDVLGVALTTSNNTLAEVLARLTAQAMKRPTTFEGSALAVMDQVQTLGVNIGDAHLSDGSGLGAGSEVPSRVLADVLGLASQDSTPALRPMLAGLPVSGFNGTLSDRFTTPPTHAAAGVVRAKTGTLTGVNSLAGTTVDADGRLLVFVLMSDQVPVGGTTLARRASDRVAAALTACGCR